jgi:nicotinic acid phosphoribosyltransferase
MVSKADKEQLMADAVYEQMRQMGVIEIDHYGEWKKGDTINVDGEAGVFTFLSVRVDAEGNPRWANVWGGPSKQEMMRSFDVDRLESFTKIKRRGKRATK